MKIPIPPTLDKAHILSYGYFFKELPPSFNSVSLGSNVDKVTWESSAKHTKSAEFSIPKNRLGRRNLRLPHPIQFVRLVELITEPTTVAEIMSHCQKSSYSGSPIIPNSSAGTLVQQRDNRSIRVNYEKIHNLQTRKAIASIDRRIILKADISNFYPSLYTHSLPWAMLGKTEVKRLRAMTQRQQVKDPLYPRYERYNKIDSAIRNCQEQQSVGIPIGPDTSRIFAEIIGCHVDEELKSNFDQLVAFRYEDDYVFYVRTKEEAELVLRRLQLVLAEVDLHLHEAKVKIHEFPIPIDDQWQTELSQAMAIPDVKTRIRQVLNVAMKWAGNPEIRPSTIFSYALAPFERKSIHVPKSEWGFFEAILLKIALIAPATFESVSRILETYRSIVNRSSVQKFLQQMLSESVPLGHDYEIVWSLWMHKQFSIRLDLAFADQIVDHGNPFSILLLLDLCENSLIGKGKSKGDPTTTTAMKDRIKSDLRNFDRPGDWLLFYEAVRVKKWIKLQKKADKFMSEMKSANISFYNENAIMTTF